MNLPPHVAHFIKIRHTGLPDRHSAPPPEVRDWLADHEDDHQLMIELTQEQLLPYGVANWLASHDEVAVRSSLALNWTIDPLVIDRLAEQDEHEEVRKAAAQNHGADSDTLEQLAEDTSAHVRMGVTWNHAYPRDVLTELENNDADPTVRSQARQSISYWEVFVRPEAEQLAELDSTTDATVLERHSRSPHVAVRKAVLVHAATPAATSKELTLGDTDPLVQVWGAQWDQARPAVLKELAEDDQQPMEPRVAAIHNGRIPRAALQRLKGHADPTIAREAEAALAARQ